MIIPPFYLQNQYHHAHFQFFYPDFQKNLFFFFVTSRISFFAVSSMIAAINSSRPFCPSSPANRLLTEPFSLPLLLLPQPACTGSSSSVLRGSYIRSSRNGYPSLRGCLPREGRPEPSCRNLRICRRLAEPLPVPVQARLGMHLQNARSGYR